MVAFDSRVDTQRRHGVFLFRDEIVHADDDLLFLLYRALKFVRGFLNFALHESGFDRTQHAAHRIDFLDVSNRAAFDLIR